jgi:proline iminopeptidase
MNYFISLLFLLVISCRGQTIPEGEGYVQVDGGKIWYKVVGKGKGVPLLIIHGGPGGRSCGSIEGYSLLSDDRPIIFYDQLGSGKSDRPTDTSLWKLPRFANEVEKLREALNLKELHILGSSWGASILIEYLATKKPKGISSAIFAGPLISTPIWMRDAKILLSKLSKNVQDTVEKYEMKKNYLAPSYLAATDSFYAHYMSVMPKQKSVLPSPCDGVPGSNMEIYNYMWGPTEFTATGTLKNFDRAKDLGKVKEPVLFIVGRYDEARPETMCEFQKLTKGSKVVIIENAGHAKIKDQPVEFTNALRKFLSSVEKK